MQKIIPPKLQSGDEIRIIAPARSLAVIGQEEREIADEWFAELGLKLSFGTHMDETDDFFSSSIASRVADLHVAFADPDDEWWMNQNLRTEIPNEGYWTLNEGEATGTILGANLCTFNLLQGTQFMPSLQDSILFLEDDYESRAHHFDRDLQSLIHLPDFAGVRGLVIGRFQKASEMTKELLTEIMRSKKQLSHIPVVANVDFGHSEPKITFPVGARVCKGCKKRGGN